MEEELYAYDQCTAALRAALIALRESESTSSSQVEWVQKLAVQKRAQLVRQVNEQLDNVTFVCKSVLNLQAPEAILLERDNAGHVFQPENYEEDEPSAPSPPASPIPVRVPKRHYVPVPSSGEEEEEEELSDSSFIEDDDKDSDELPIFDDPAFDTIFAGRPPARKKRVSKAPQKYSPPPKQDDGPRKKHQDEDIRLGSSSKYDQDNAQLVLTRSKNQGLRTAIEGSLWFRDRYLTKIDQIRSNLGLQKSDSVAQKTWDCMYNHALDHGTLSGLEFSTWKVKDTCCSCGCQRHCTYTIKLPDNTRGVLGNKCASVAFALNSFLSTLIEANKFDSGKDWLKKLDMNMLDLEQAQENKTINSE